MVFAISSCLNQFHPLSCSITNSSPSKIAQVTRQQKEESWKKQSGALGIACTIILGVEIGGFAVADQEIALAWDLQNQRESRVNSKSKIQRWSDRRSCPPWHLNSLETIVPENLPRPAARRRWEAIGFYYSDDKASFHVLVEVPPQSKKCFLL